MRSDAETMDAYLAELPENKRALVSALRDIVLEHLPAGYVEVMNWGMISFEVPMEVSGKTYNGAPLMYAAIGAQKAHVGLYLCGLNCNGALQGAFEAAYAEAGVKLDMGKACLRVKREDEIVPTAIASAIASMTPQDFAAASAR